MPYRDDVDHLKRRLAAVTDELADVRRKTQAYDELKTHGQALEDEAAELQRELSARERRRTLPLLDNVQVASPCDADWDEMLGDERKRFCAHCAKSVYNLSAMKRAEAEALIEQSEGKLCVRLYRRADGTVLTEDCPVGVRRRRRRWVAVTALAFGVMTGASLLFLAQKTTGEMAPCPATMGSFMPAELPPPSAAPAVQKAPATPATTSAATPSAAPGGSARKAMMGRL